MFGGSVEAQDGDDYQRAAGAAFEALEGIIRQGIRAGVFRDRDPQELSLAAWMAMHGMAMWMIARLLDAGSMDPAAIDEQVRSVARNLIYGISK